ncbi:MAG: PAS domain-containing protein [Smithellaceae bacterium]
MKEGFLTKFLIVPKDDPKQALRISRFLMASAAYFICAILCTFAYVAGFVTKEAFLGWSAAAVSINIVLFIVFRTGLNQKMADPSLTAIQMCSAIVMVMYVMMFANETRGVFLLIYVVILLFGIFQLDTRRFLYVSVFTLLTYGGVIVQLHLYRPQGVNFSMEYLQWVVLAGVVMLFSVIGGHISGLRDKISKDRSTIQRLTNNIPDVIFVFDTNLNCTYVSPSVKSLLGYEPEEILKQKPFEGVTASSLDLTIRTVSEIIELAKTEQDEDISRTIQMKINRKDGIAICTEMKFAIIRDKQKKSFEILAVMRDITERKKMMEAIRRGEEKYRTILEHIQEGYFEVDLKGDFTFCNDSMARLTGCTKEELIGMNHKHFTTKETAEKVFQEFNKVLKTGKPSRGFDWLIIRKDQSQGYIEASVTLKKDSSGKPIGFEGMVRDVTERKQIEEQIRHLATHDVLTDLPTMRLAKDRLKMAISLAKRNKTMMAVMFIDLDGFKDVNDTLGHDAGDYVLKQVADRLLSCVRSSDTVARVGGDEFLIIANGIHVPQNAEQIAKKLINNVSQPINFNGGQAVVGASIGIALCPNDGQDMDQLIKQADDAMYKIKKTGKNGFCFINGTVK